MQDPYEVLGIDRSASTDDVKVAFRRLAQKYHPDRNPGDESAQHRFKELNAAYQILSDPEKRARFDRLGGAAFGGPGFENVDLGNLDLDAIFGDFLRGFGIRNGPSGDLRTEVTISFEESISGCEKPVTYERIEPCQECAGSGSARGHTAELCATCGGRGRIRVQQGLFPIALERSCPRCQGTGRIVTHPCGACRGAGLVSAAHVVTVEIPPGIEDGATRVIAGAGNVTRVDRSAGNLEIAVKVESHPVFRRVGDDVLCVVPLSVPQAVLGGEVDVPTVEGRGKLRVPTGTQPGTVLRIRGKGVPHRFRGGRGDQLVEVTVEIPRSLTPRQRELFEELAKESGHEPSEAEPKTFVQKLKELFG